jgi:DNA-binding NarL/FixJ family response regulator
MAGAAYDWANQRSESDSMISIFIVDDHFIVREGLRSILEDAGHSVLGEADNTTTALSEILRLDPDVVLLDLSLGTLSGLDLLPRLKTHGSRARVIMLTMMDQPRNIAQAIRAGAMGYVLKGSSGAELSRAIQEVMQGRRYFSADVADRAFDALLTGPGDDPFESLSARELQILELVVRGQSSAAIGEALHLSPKTVDTYRSRLMTKLDVHDVASLVRLAIREGLVDSDLP